MIQSLIAGKDAEIENLKESEKSLLEQIKQLSSMIRENPSRLNLMSYQDSMEKILPAPIV
jgi:hypothetical protein